jgi:surface protein
MAITTIDDKHLTNIATAIRQKSGVEDTFKPSEMASAIKNISGGEPILEDLEVSPTTSEQVITAHQGYDGINQITIAPVTNLIDDDIRPENIKKGVEILGVTGNIEDKPADPVLQNKTIEPNIGKQIITADSGYDGLGQVTVNGVTSSIDSNIRADNIKQGVSILGVQGTLEQGAEVVKKYKPKHMTFKDGEVSDLTEETKMLDTSLLTTMKSMFFTTIETTIKVESIDISEWDTSNVTNMSQMFRETKIKNIDISHFDTSKVTTMNQMFRSCSNLETINITNLDTSSLKDFSEAFSYCKKLKEINLSSAKFEKVTKCHNLFYGSTALEKIDIRNATFSKATTKYTMFTNVPSNCLIIVKDDVEKSWILTERSDLTNVKTLAEYQAEGGV